MIYGDRGDAVCPKLLLSIAACFEPNCGAELSAEAEPPSPRQILSHAMSIHLLMI